MKNCILLSIGLALAFTVQAQSDERPWSIGLHGGITQYNGDRGQNFYKTKQSGYGFAGASISRYISPHWDVSLFTTYGQIGNKEVSMPWTTPDDEATSYFRTQLSTTHLIFRFHFVGPEHNIRPFLFAGAGLIVYEKDYSLTHQRVEGSLPTFGLGANLRLTDFVKLQLQESFMYTTTDNVDKTIGGGSNDAYLYHTVGLIFEFGKMKDEDADGVADKKDHCLSTPAGVAVDENGCPLDVDKDGVADYVDECPQLAGTIVMKGCPDTDLDGIADKNDRCPTAAGPLSALGCPDTDKDGVVDIDDKCPNTLVKYKTDISGCPVDTDGDGIFNEDDRCPTIAGALALQGCADTDKDGVSDLDDRCPAVVGTLANKGCPEIAKEDLKKITTIASKIYFETGKATLKAESYAQLDALVEILKKYEGAILIIEGHTDNVGEDAYNMDLSQRRTESVKAYLMSKGILESRLVAIGYGETKPID
ncbi:MAG TPA: OmpA family protein, partial [Bacteroidia bacterium]|nr:OmpA family protein [Bacteroidia bacterium]